MTAKFGALAAADHEEPCSGAAACTAIGCMYVTSLSFVRDGVSIKRQPRIMFGALKRVLCVWQNPQQVNAKPLFGVELLRIPSEITKDNESIQN